MKFSFKIFVILIQFCSNFININESAKILAVFPFPGRSQYILVQPFLQTLAARGHNITVINAYPGKEKIENYRDIAVLEIHKRHQEFLLLSKQERNLWNEMTFLSDFFTYITQTVMSNSQVQNLIETETFDLVILEAENIDALYSFGAHFNAPIIGVSSYGTDPVIDELMGNISPFSYVPLMSTGFTDDMSYLQRIQNLVLKLLELIHNRWVHLPRHEKLKDLYMPHIKQYIKTLRQNMSLYLVNQHFSLSFPRSYVTNMIEIGGIQLQHQVKPLPLEIQEFLENSPQDAIYFSMGSNVKSKDLPVETLKIFNEVFAELPYKILWKFEDTQLPGKPENVLISPWFPQTDILAHKKVKLFISHGGLLSIFETVHHAKPILGLPVFFDQHMNINKAVQKGFALRLDFPNFNKEQLKSTILELMNNPLYTKRVQEISLIYHDQPIKPMDLAVYWTEYVLRHNGAFHLQNPAQKMGYFKKHGIDCWAGLIIFVISILLIMIWLLKILFKLVFVKKFEKFKED